MIERIHTFFRNRIAPRDLSEDDAEHRVHLATAALFIEMTKADFEVKDEESAAVLDAVRRVLEISDDEARTMLSLAEAEARESVSLYEFTRLVNDSFSPERKKEVVELLWRIAFADAQLEAREEHLVRKVARLLHVSHRDFIDAKRRARDTGSPAG
jgi:uncharacterized tellurite resistance protein B-like protein